MTTEIEEARIREVIDDWTAAIDAKDADRVVSHHAPEFVQFSLAPPLRSEDADARGLNAWFATWQGPIGCEIRDLAVTVGGETAFCHGLNRMTGTKTGGDEVDLWFRLTLCLRRTGDAWKIAHEHTSVPFYMDGSLKAAVDLRP